MEQLASDIAGSSLRRTMPERGPDLTVVENEANLQNGGFSLPIYDAEVAKPSELQNIDSCKHGMLEERVITMDDGTQYDIIKGYPRVQRSDTAIEEQTAWWTHPRLEHNLKSIRASLWLGYPTLMIGPPKGFAAGNVSLSKAVYDAHRIADAELESLGVDPLKLIVKGASRAAMTGIGMSIQQYARDREIPMVDATAACVVRKFKLNEWPEVLQQLGDESKSIVSIGYEYARRGQLPKYLFSLPPKDASHVLNAFRIFPGLIGGEAGDLADASNPKSAVHLVEFDSDFWGQTADWEDKFKDRRNVRVVRKPGTHIGGIAQSKTRRDTNGRLFNLLEVRGYDGSFDKIDYQKDIFDAEQVTCSALFKMAGGRSKVA